MTHERNGKPMRYTDEQIRSTILDHINETDQHELRYIIPFCIGFYGYITGQIWRVIRMLMQDGDIE